VHLHRHMPPKMDAADIDQRIAMAVAAALAAERQAPAQNSAHVGSVAVKLPDFWVSDPDMWFFQAEASFRNARITVSRTKFDHVVTRLPEHVSVSVKTLLLSVTDATEDPYEQLKAKLTARYGKTKWQSAFALLDHPDLGDRRPSIMMTEMLSLLPPGSRPDTVFLALFLRRLPPSMRDHLMTKEVDTAEELADLADKLWDARANQPVAAIEADVAAIRPFSPGRQGRSPDRRQQRQKPRQATPHEGRRREHSWCRNHRRLGDKTKNCIPPCSYGAEN